MSDTYLEYVTYPPYCLENPPFEGETVVYWDNGENKYGIISDTIVSHYGSFYVELFPIDYIVYGAEKKIVNWDQVRRIDERILRKEIDNSIDIINNMFRRFAEYKETLSYFRPDFFGSTSEILEPPNIWGRYLAFMFIIVILIVMFLIFETMIN